jgi:hypothetical protein
MAIMAAGMHNASIDGGVGKARGLRDGKRIHVSTKPHPAIALSLAPDHADNPRAANSGMNLIDAESAKLIGNNGTCAAFLKPDFRMGMKIAEDCSKAQGLLFDCGYDRHQFLSSQC